jgi:hypothetical protein
MMNLKATIRRLTLSKMPFVASDDGEKSSDEN